MLGRGISTTSSFCLSTSSAPWRQLQGAIKPFSPPRRRSGGGDQVSLCGFAWGGQTRPPKPLECWRPIVRYSSASLFLGGPYSSITGCLVLVAAFGVLCGILMYFVQCPSSSRGLLVVFYPLITLHADQLKIRKEEGRRNSME